MIEQKRVGPDEAIAIISIDRAKSRNALSGAVISALSEAFANLRDDTSCRAIILTGNGGFFSAGADLTTFEAVSAETDPNRVLRSLATGGRLCQEIETMPQMTIAAIEGGAVGGGLGLAVSCDWRVMANTAFAFVPEVKLGLNYGWNTLPRLARLVGPARTKTMSILCRRHPAAECEAWGLADRVVDQGTTLASAIALAEEVCALPRLAAQTVKRQVNAYATSFSDNASFADMELMLVCLADPEGAQARDAFTRAITEKGQR